MNDINLESICKVVRSFNNGKYVIIGPENRNIQSTRLQTIVNTITNTIVAVLPVPPKNSYDEKEIKSNFNDAKVKLMANGTVLTLSFFENGWKISTFRGICMNNIKNNGITYQEAVIQVLLNYNFNLDNLDKGVSYTFIITHPILHPFETKCSAIFVQAIDIKKYSENRQDFNHFTVQNTTNIPEQKNINIDCGELFSNCNRAYTYHINKTRTIYGYIVYINNISYAIESSLYKKIRMIFYGKPQENPDIIDSRYKFLKGINEFICNIPQLIPHKTTTYNVINETIDRLANDLVFSKVSDCKYRQNIALRYSQFKYYNNYSEKEQVNKAKSFIRNIVNINDLYFIIDWSSF